MTGSGASSQTSLARPVVDECLHRSSFRRCADQASLGAACARSGGHGLRLRDSQHALSARSGNFAGWRTLHAGTLRRPMGSTQRISTAIVSRSAARPSCLSPGRTPSYAAMAVVPCRQHDGTRGTDDSQASAARSRSRSGSRAGPGSRLPAGPRRTPDHARAVRGRTAAPSRRTSRSPCWRAASAPSQPRASPQTRRRRGRTRREERRSGRSTRGRRCRPGAPTDMTADHRPRSGCRPRRPCRRPRGRRRRAARLRSSSSKPATIPAEAIAPMRPSASHGSRCHRGATTAPPRPCAALRRLRGAAEARGVLLVLLERTATPRGGRGRGQRLCRRRRARCARSRHCRALRAPPRHRRARSRPRRARRPSAARREQPLDRDEADEALAVQTAIVDGAREEPPARPARRRRGRAASGRLAGADPFGTSAQRRLVAPPSPARRATPGAPTARTTASSWRRARPSEGAVKRRQVDGRDHERGGRRRCRERQVLGPAPGGRGERTEKTKTSSASAIVAKAIVCAASGASSRPIR